ncbi:MAG: hypothetical protein ACI80S_000183 [Pseudohongiellaceae bacterium]
MVSVDATVEVVKINIKFEKVVEKVIKNMELMQQ